MVCHHDDDSVCDKVLMAMRHPLPPSCAVAHTLSYYALIYSTTIRLASSRTALANLYVWQETVRDKNLPCGRNSNMIVVVKRVAREPISAPPPK